MEPPWNRGAKVCSNGPGHMTKMATMPIYGINPLKIFFCETSRPMTFASGILHWGLGPFVQIMILGWLWPSLRQAQLCFLMLLYGKMLNYKTVLKPMNWKLVQIVDLASTWIYMSTRGQGHRPLSKVTLIYTFKHHLLLLWSRYASRSQIS